MRRWRWTVGAVSVVALAIAPSTTLARSERVASCGDFSIQGLRASHVRRASSIRCALVRRLIRATYAGGGYRHTYPFYTASGKGYGNVIDWFHGGWRCSVGAGGAACSNAARRRFNVIDNGTSVEVAILADTR
jgi:hypothetical protein